jgi:tetratricopeptide (TPR) repeat protein
MEAIPTYREAHALFEPLTKAQPDNLDLQFDYGNSLNGLGLVQNSNGDPRGATVTFRHAESILKALADQERQGTKYRNALAGVLSNIGEVQLYGLAQHFDALRSFQNAAAIQEKLAKEDPNDVMVQDYLGAHYMGIANTYFYLRMWKECLAANLKSVTIRENLARQNPRVTRYQSVLVQSYVNVAQVGVILQQVDSALAIAKKAIDLMENNLRDNPDEIEYHYSLAQALQTRADALLAKKQYEEMATTLEQAISHQRISADKAPNNMTYQQSLGSHYILLGEAQAKLGQIEKARAAWQQAAQVWEGFAQKHPADLGFAQRLVAKLIAIAMAQQAAGLSDDAMATYKRALEYADGLLSRQAQNPLILGSTIHVADKLAQLYLNQNKVRDALPLLQRTVDLQAVIVQITGSSAEQRQLATFQLHLGVAQIDNGQKAEALTSLQAARSILEQLPKPKPVDSYDLACTVARVSQALADQPERAQAEADTAMKLLRAANAAGYRDVAHMEKDHDLDVLRTRVDFQQFMAELKEKKTGP